MKLDFVAEAQEATFESPFKGFEPATMKGEVRIDPLSGHVCRIVPFRLKPFEPVDLTQIVERSKETCPFCPEVLEAKTSRFLPSFGVPGGRIREGCATLFPNAFPYARHSAVAVLGPDHFVEPADFRPELAADGLAAAKAYLIKIVEQSPDCIHASVNCNYMPLSGAGLIHPHVQVLASNTPTRYQATLLRAAGEFNGQDSGAIFDALLEHEISDGSRYVGRTGEIHWLSAFAPKGLMDLWGVLPRSSGFLSLSSSLMRDLADGMSRVIRFFGSRNIQSFNFSLYTSAVTDADSVFHLVRLIPRVNLPGFGVSDINYFERMHDESTTFFTPEEIAEGLRTFFQS